MFKLGIPGFKDLRLRHLVMDFNGTLALDGRLIPGVVDRLSRLEERLEIFVVTSDTFGTVREQVEGLARVKILESTDHREEKRIFVSRLGAESVAAIGNGRNDAAMLEEAGLGIAVCLGEGAASEAILAADVVCTGIGDALDLLLHPGRLLATLRA